MCGLYDALKATNPENVLYGFKKGPSGLLEDDYLIFDDAYIDQYRNTGGFDIIGSGRTTVSYTHLFITTKIWISNAGYEKAKKSIDESLKKLKTDYIDLLLIHQPFGDYYGSYRAMEEAVEEGKVRAIGVSNFSPDRFIDLQHFAKIKPAVNQIETHVFQPVSYTHLS